jgi:hypothetical protein
MIKSGRSRRFLCALEPHFPESVLPILMAKRGVGELLL